MFLMTVPKGIPSIPMHVHTCLCTSHTHEYAHIYTHLCAHVHFHTGTNQKPSKQTKKEAESHTAPSTSELRSAEIPNTAQHSPQHTHPHFLKLHLPRAAAVSKSVLFVNTIKNPTATHHHPRGKWLPALKHSTVIAINGNGSPMAEPCALCSKLTP